MSNSWFQSISNIDEHEELFRTVFDIILDQVTVKGVSRSSPVVRWRDPEYLKYILRLPLPEEAISKEELVKKIQNVVTFSVNIGHPHFVNQLFSGLDPYGLIGQLITDVLNPSVYTFEVAPVFTLMESEVLAHMRRMVGFTEGDGMFCPGGSFSNGYAINLARYKTNPKYKAVGGGNSPRLVLFTSEDSHYSVQKMAAFLGIGEDNAIPVKVDSRGSMDAVELELQIAMAINDGCLPFMVLATAGTTVLGAFDPLPLIYEVCKKYKLWFHVDAAWGGGLLFSKKYKHLLDGIHLADSVTWNPHKLLAVPQQCSVLLTRHPTIQHPCCSKQADYLFQKDKFYDTSYDSGDKSLQCGRRVDVFKFWLMWQAKGSDGFEKHVDSVFDCSKYLYEKVQARAGFTIVAEPQFINVCFWYIPPFLRGLQGHPDYLQMLHKIAPQIKERMVKRGSMMISYQPLRNWPNFFRFVCQNSALTHDDMDFFLDEIEKFGNEIETPII